MVAFPVIAFDPALLSGAVVRRMGRQGEISCAALTAMADRASKCFCGVRAIAIDEEIEPRMCRVLVDPLPREVGWIQASKMQIIRPNSLCVLQDFLALRQHLSSVFQASFFFLGWILGQTLQRAWVERRAINSQMTGRAPI